ncbi:trigger factor [Candidatus Uhrbacteria bacterium RIFCSPHIGHO2_02_FULL_60_10]|uniref:Trigger factor n=1 Tax=Candidatus Uhrbacteria bacterium RIFCSPHIGHO2_02_FULL_60_10 TaxID=1802392 RepID=A0A1F7U8H3_9BACT|nr:MAG: trigger factor [Candidatus Uhrbacteria bacterium RIFCSPHIGHO2_02_FULL_60_10]
MSFTVKNLPKGEVEFSFEIPHEEIQHDLEHAARHLQEHKAIPGFRAGKAPYDVAKNTYGEMAIYEDALPVIVRRAYVKAVLDGKYRAYGEPTINITKLAPGNPDAFTAKITLVPAIKSLADFRKIKIDSKVPEVPEKDVDQAVAELRKMRTKEARVNREVRTGDKVVVDMDLTLDKVPLDGGQARNHGVFLDEEYYVPGFRDQVLGLKEGEQKSFSLKFPDTHYQKNIAGRDVDFAVTVKEIHELIHPDVNDEFAKSLGQPDLPTLRGLIKGNMAKEADEKESQRAEIAMLDAIVDKSKFEDIPEKIVNTEVERMVSELQQSVAGRGLKFEDYLQNIKKTLADLKLDFAPQAIRRVKTALAIRDIGDAEKIEVADAEVLAEVEKLMERYKDDAESQAKVRSDDYQDWLRTTMRNRKVLELLNKEMVKKS